MHNKHYLIQCQTFLLIKTEIKFCHKYVLIELDYIKEIRKQHNPPISTEIISFETHFLSKPNSWQMYFCYACYVLSTYLFPGITK